MFITFIFLVNVYEIRVTDEMVCESNNIIVTVCALHIYKCDCVISYKYVNCCTYNTIVIILLVEIV